MRAASDSRAIQGARIAGARDDHRGRHVRAEARDWPRRFGATHTVDASSTDPVEAIQKLTDGGVDYSFEAIGLKKAAEQCFDALAPGGTATIIGMIPVGQKVEIDGSQLLTEKRIQGSLHGLEPLPHRHAAATSISTCRAGSTSTT